MYSSTLFGTGLLGGTGWPKTAVYLQAPHTLMSSSIRAHNTQSSWLTAAVSYLMHVTCMAAQACIMYSGHGQALRQTPINLSAAVHALFVDNSPAGDQHLQPKPSMELPPLITGPSSAPL